MANRLGIICVLLCLLSGAALHAAPGADGAASGDIAAAADALIGYRWQPVLLSSWTSGVTPEVKANEDAFKTLVAAEKASGQGKYLKDIINGFWYYTTAHTWSIPSETGGKLPPREGQSPTPTSLRTADMLIDAWAAFSDRISPGLPVLGPSLEATLERLTGKKSN